MKEEEARNIIQKSVVHTSDDFTDQLMSRIALEEKKVPSVKLRFLPLFIGCLAVLGFAVLLSWWASGLSMSNDMLNPSILKRIFQIGISLFLIISVNFIYSLKKSLSY
ncbi:hypothetical protein GCM10011506_22950 [Marivirga lumbricoides]|uniref:DUF5056 domain-containing protein n=1 Tax=Marivirga lumbricoides TaxID=1046115 RepID=A0ABQ1M9P1_9BACT|nr:hypothetical protein GCM10011506_22950 [Marivirga lumbricoides]